MTNFRFWEKTLPLQWLFRPWFLVALGLHIVALSIPLPPEPEANRLSTEDLSVDGVRLVSLPSPPSRPPTSPADSAPASTLATPAPSTAPKATSLNVVPSLAPQPLASPSPQPQIVSESLSALPEAPTPQPLASPSSETLTPALPEPQSIPTPQLTPPDQTAIPVNFPHAVGSQPGCGGRNGCWQNENTQWRSIATTLKQDLENQGYTLTPVEIGSDTGMRIYQVSKMGEPPYYLNLLSTLQGTVYIVSEEPLTPEELTAMVNT